ncbi:MAG: DUF1851 domain-containing protein [Oscillospiraceae bacterium]|nr:DUF1851 domain-containing protein [Oscillospiraceae bacterium]
MFQQFRSYFDLPLPITASEKSEADALIEFRNEFQGMEFGEGIYRVFRTEDVSKWKELIASGYRELKGCFEPFGFDWLGRCFSIDLRSTRKGQILMFEIGTAEVLQIPCNFLAFHNKEIPTNAEACLSESFFHQWRKVSRQKIRYTDCIGYIVPLFLNGKDDVENLELSDMEVYWSLVAQIKNQI